MKPLIVLILAGAISAYENEGFARLAKSGSIQADNIEVLSFIIEPPAVAP